MPKYSTKPALTVRDAPTSLRKPMVKAESSGGGGKVKGYAKRLKSAREQNISGRAMSLDKRLKVIQVVRIKV